MKAIIYVITVNNTIRYVGSSRESHYARRIHQHVTDDKWLKSVDQSTVKFLIIDDCDESIRFELEGSHYDRLISLGLELENKRHPRLTGKPMNSEMAKIAVATKRKNKTIGNAGKANKGQKRPNISKIVKGRVFSEEAKRKMSLAKLGKPNGRSGIKRPSIALSQKKRWQEIHLIMKEFDCSFKEATEIRRKRVKVS